MKRGRGGREGGREGGMEEESTETYRGETESLIHITRIGQKGEEG